MTPASVLRLPDDMLAGLSGLVAPLMHPPVGVTGYRIAIEVRAPNRRWWRPRRRSCSRPGGGLPMICDKEWETDDR